MNCFTASSIDTGVYVEYDKDTKAWCVLGDITGFVYDSCSTKEQADRIVVAYGWATFPPKQY